MNVIERMIMRLAARTAIAQSDPGASVQYLLKEVLQETDKMFNETNEDGINKWLKVQLDIVIYNYWLANRNNRKQ